MREPFAIDTKVMIQRPTPAAFRPLVTSATVPMLPLVRDQTRRWNAGWCTYSDGFDENPDIEVFCGGENEKTSRAAACWRQGNLLHFGFEQSPAEMNEAGQRLLLNCIAYVSRFTEERPIAVTPSVFAGPVAYPRAYLDRRLGEAGDVSDAAWLLSERAVERLKGKSREEVKNWYAENRPFLHPGPGMNLEIDEDAHALGSPVDRIEFFEKTIAALRAGDERAQRAARLLARYAPVGADKKEDAMAWEKWFEENRPYLFFSDQGDYRWYVDPLAKRRGVPTKELRGLARASRP
ncbi:MAG: hypothetical protein DME19_18770 [Verrucomicrobia bacterium]|nr:MAG: hypothetical protein DME19_18770 [Verrucomicrobiota bacterium]